MTIKCLACGSNLRDRLFCIPELPLVDSFTNSIEEALKIPCFTVDLRQCNKCLTVQIADPPDTSEIYRNYIYDSSSSPDLEKHFEDYAQYIHSLLRDHNEPILEIGANDGLLLEKLNQIGFTNLAGIDPSPQTKNINICDAEIINDFFNAVSAGRLSAKKYRLIIANNCFSHIPNLSETLSLCAELLTDDGALIVEVQSCLDLVEGVIFDYIYHEHFYYHSAQSFQRLANISGLELYNIEHVETKGGSYRFMLGIPGAHNVSQSVNYWIYREEIAQIHTRHPWTLLERYLDITKQSLFNLVSRERAKIVGYGASATGTVLLRYMGLEKEVECIVDDNVKRQGLFSPKTAIPILSPSILSNKDVCLILAWRHSKFIIPGLDKIGVRHISPLPFLRTDG